MCINRPFCPGKYNNLQIFCSRLSDYLENGEALGADRLQVLEMGTERRPDERTKGKSIEKYFKSPWSRQQPFKRF